MPSQNVEKDIIALESASRPGRSESVTKLLSIAPFAALTRARPRRSTPLSQLNAETLANAWRDVLRRRAAR